MTKIVVVSGVGNSGKTGSIRLFLENRGIFFPDYPRDILLVLSLDKKGKTYVVGVASGGDSLAIVRKNFAFFRTRPCDIIVCAAKSSGATVTHIQSIGVQRGNQLSNISSTWVSGPAISVANANIAAAIESNIP